MSTTPKSRLMSYAPAIATFLAACGRAPSVDILGSFFPAWLVCFSVAVVFSALIRFVLLRFHMKVELPVLTYLSLTALFTFALWLIFCY